MLWSQDYHGRVHRNIGKEQSSCPGAEHSICLIKQMDIFGIQVRSLKPLIQYSYHIVYENYYPTGILWESVKFNLFIEGASNSILKLEARRF